MEPVDANVVGVIDKSEEMFDSGHKQDLAVRAVLSGEEGVPERVGGVELCFGGVEGSGRLRTHTVARQVVQISASSGKDVPGPFKVSVTVLASGQVVCAEVMELIQEIGRARNLAHVLLRYDVSASVKEMLNFSKTSDDVTNPIEGAIGGSESFKEGNKRAGDKAFIDTEVFNHITKDVRELRSIAGVNVHSENVSEPEDRDVELRHDWDPSGSRLRETVSSIHHTITDSKDMKEHVCIGREEVGFTTLMRVHREGSSDFEQSRST